MADSSSGPGSGIADAFGPARSELKAASELLVALQALVGTDFDDKGDALPAALAAAEESLGVALKAFSQAWEAKRPVAE